MLKIAIILAVAFSAFGNPVNIDTNQQNERIIGGTPVDIEQFPYNAFIFVFNPTQTPLCGAAIVSDLFVLTVAHCVQGFPAYNLEVIVGATIITFPSTRYTVGSTYVHPAYNPVTLNYDIALLRLNNYIVGVPNAHIIPMVDINEVVNPGALADLTGYGATSSTGGTLGVLHHVQTLITSDQECRAAYGENVITDTMICADVPGGGIGFCDGDSGSPLVVHGELVGLVSWSSGCALNGFPGVYTKISSLRSFIDSVITRKY